MYRMEEQNVEGITFMAAISAVDGSLIGEEERAERLVARGIAPQRGRRGTVASIGFCQREQKWYGWSHRAIFGFGIGYAVKQGDCGYVPVDEADCVAAAVRFWTGEGHDDVRGVFGKGGDGAPGVHVSWTFSNDIPNERLRGSAQGSFIHAPTVWGRGEWTAATLEDARQMAENFAEGVS
jgi:hypothetical protein